MCPSYMATKDERDTTRARANMLRQVLTHPRDVTNPWDSKEVKQVMDLCLSCKGCKSECPSNVDVARLKAEWQQHYYDSRGTPLRTRLFAGYTDVMQAASLAPAVYNRFIALPGLSHVIKRICGIAPRRSLPPVNRITLAAWFARRTHLPQAFPHGRVHLFCDEFTNYNDTAIGIKAVGLLNRLGYEVAIPRHVDSGRAHFSKGLVRQGRARAVRNVELLADVITDEMPLIGIEPSALLSFRDEYPDLVPAGLKAKAKSLARRALLIDEFVAREAAAGHITSRSFTPSARAVRLHGHCHQKALSSLAPTAAMLALPINYRVQVIPSGCCGMAGSFGYEAEHFAISQQIGELVLFPAVRATPPETLIAAGGTSCRHQIKDATGRQAYHPIELLHDALV